PWVERNLLVRGSGATVTLDLPVPGPVADGPARLVLGLGTITDLPDLRDAQGRPIPEHNVEVWARGPSSSFVPVTASSASGQRDWRIEATLPAGLLQQGVNQVQLRFTTQYLFSLVVVDRYGVRYPSPYRGPSLDFAPDPFADGYRVEGFATPGAVAYAEGADGSLTRIDTRVSAAGGGYTLEVQRADAARFWVTEAPHTPEVFTTEAPPDLLAGPADLVVIAGSGLAGTQALDDYAAQRAALDPVVIDVEDVYNAVGYGMALPSAITDDLAARDAVYPFTHVQLVGADCYDRLNYVSQCVSFVPLPTARVAVTRYSPSQNRLVDFDGDGIGDKAVAQFSVRTEAELATIVAKGSAWSASGLSAGGSALLIAEESNGVDDFAGQIGRLAGRLGWSGAEVLDLADHPSIATARAALNASLASGRALTVFSGHSSPTVWAFRSLLTPGTAAALTNHGRPTIMVPLACETTYDISPSANVLGHQLLYAGGQGALAISGAVSLASLRANERMAEHVIDGLKAGLTLGQAVQAGRDAIGSSNRELQDNWITQGDVTVRLEQ
ncbi:MAG TPA: C25 family cysteine peptidase, partial [Thermoanaerobaculia bacterium]|nr:C25 family cysteine peptidase [Thermoanaerobaculia bacterium]